MRNPPPVDINSDPSDAIQATAKMLVRRANDIAVVPAKVRALELARLVLRDAAHFGQRELGDLEILAALEALNIGPATFRKALADARKELVRKPAVNSKPRSKDTRDKAPAGPPLLPRAAPMVAADPLVVANVDRKLL